MPDNRSPTRAAADVSAQHDSSSANGSDLRAIPTTFPTFPDGTVFPGAAGLFVRFCVMPHKLPANVTVAITPTIGDDTYQPIVARHDNSSPVWQVVSSKYIDDSEFSYTMTVEVDDPTGTDPPISYSTAGPIKVALVQGQLKYIASLAAVAPTPPPDKIATINEYISRVASN